MVRISLAEDDAGIADVANEQLSALDEADRSGGAGGRGETRGGLLPVGQVGPHGLLRAQESLSDGLQDEVVVFGPEVFLLGDGVHKVILKC